MAPAAVPTGAPLANSKYNSILEGGAKQRNLLASVTGDMKVDKNLGAWTVEASYSSGLANYTNSTARQVIVTGAT